MKTAMSKFNLDMDWDFSEMQQLQQIEIHKTKI